MKQTIPKVSQDDPSLPLHRRSLHPPLQTVNRPPAHLSLMSKVAREAATIQRAAAERERHVHLHAKREADRAERDHHASAEVWISAVWCCSLLHSGKPFQIMKSWARSAPEAAFGKPHAKR